MSAAIKDGGPAFPGTPTDRSGQIASFEPGMTLRDYFAAKWLAGLGAAPNLATTEIKVIAEECYAAADAMLAAREAKQ